MEEGRNAFRILTGKPTGKRPLGRPRSWEDSIRMDLKKIGIYTRNWADLAQDRDYWRTLVLVKHINTFMSIRLHLIKINIQ